MDLVDDHRGPCSNSSSADVEVLFDVPVIMSITVQSLFYHRVSVFLESVYKTALERRSSGLDGVLPEPGAVRVSD